MTRGNQRDIDRERAQKRKEKTEKDKNNDFGKRKLTDADIMREKQKKAEEKRQKEEEEKIKQSHLQATMKKFEEIKLEDDDTNGQSNN